MARALTFLIAGLGSLGFWLLGLPLPFLLGPMFACLIAALAGGELKGAGHFGIFMRTFLGVVVGASITPELLSRLPEIASSLLIVPLFIGTIAALGFPLLRYGFGLDPVTACYSAMPGGLQDMLTFGEEAGSDPRALSLIHATRVLVIVCCAPFLMHLVWDLDLSVAPGQPMVLIAPSQLGFMIVAGLLGASILRPMILTTVLSLAGVIQARPPAEIIQAA